MDQSTAIEKRLRVIRRRMYSLNFPALFITDSISRRYLTGFTGTFGTVLITPGTIRLFTDFRYAERASAEVPSIVAVSEMKQNTILDIIKTLRQQRIKKIGIEDYSLTMFEYAQVQKFFRSFKLVGLKSLIQDIRAIKDELELINLRKAVQATDSVFMAVTRWLKTCRRAKRWPTEKDVAWRVEDLIHQKRLGELAFDTIVATGKHSARPHHEPTSRRLKTGEMVIIDMGVKINGYHADMSRTIFLGRPASTQEAIFKTTLLAQTKAISYLKNGGRSASQADEVARKIIDKKFTGAWGHALGHGVGLEIHEAPTLGLNSQERLKNNMVFSVEPGVYLPGVGGARIEDLVLLKSGGIEVLSRAPKTLARSIL